MYNLNTLFNDQCKTKGFLMMWDRKNVLQNIEAIKNYVESSSHLPQ